MKREITIEIAGREYVVTAERSGDRIVVEHDGQRYSVAVVSDTVVGNSTAPAASTNAERDPARSGSSARGGTTATPSGSGEVSSPMTGVVDQVLVQRGQSVADGQTIVVLEAMKMYIDVVAPVAGSVATILVKPGDAVKEGQALIRLG